MTVSALTNLDRAKAAWGADMPPWVRLLASACDTGSQRSVADRLGKSSPYISRVLNRNYAGSYEEAETIVRSVYGREDVVCPLWADAIPLSSCLRARRRKSPAQNQQQLLHDRTCPTCPNNTDRRQED